MNKAREPLFRVVKRENTSWKTLVSAYCCAVLLALVIGAILLQSLSVPFAPFYRDMFSVGTIGNRFAYKQVEGFIRTLVPLLLTSVALSLAFRMRFWNIGGEGQFILGALCAGFVAFRLEPVLQALFSGLPGGQGLCKGFLLLGMSVAGMAGGGLYGAFAAVLKVRYGTNETLMTLMLNYVAMYLLLFVGETKASWNFFLSTASERPVFAAFPAAAQMPVIPAGVGRFSLNISLVIGLLICVGVHVYLRYTKQGYELAVVGDSPNTARYAGMKVDRIVVRTMLLSAALIGLAGAFYASSAGVLSTSVTNGVGWTGIVVAWLSKLNTAAIVVVSVLITVLQVGTQAASTSYPSVDANYADLLQGVILFAVLTADFFTRFQLVWRKKGQREVAQ